MNYILEVLHLNRGMYRLVVRHMSILVKNEDHIAMLGFGMCSSRDDIEIAYGMLLDSRKVNLAVGCSFDHSGISSCDPTIRTTIQ